MRRAGFIIGAAGVAAGTIAGSLLLSGLICQVPMTVAMAGSNFADIVTTDTGAGRAVIGANGLICLVLGGKIFYECGKTVLALLKNSGGLGGIGRVAINTVTTKQLIPNTLPQLGSLANRGISAVLLVTFSTFAVVSSLAFLYVGYHCIKKVGLSLKEKD